MKSKVYTRGGDKGRTSLADGSRVRKNDARLEAYGTVDELSSHLGLLIAEVEATEGDDAERAATAAFLTEVQQRLFSLGGWLATPCATTADGDDAASAPICYLTAAHVAAVEAEIDRLDALLAPLTQFVLPGGTHATAQAHVCRTVCRRAERAMVTLAEEHYVNEILMQWTNRLSDYLFVLARFLNKIGGKSDIFWQKS